MNSKKLTLVEEQLLDWFKQRPMQKVSAEELRDGANLIWGRDLLDGPRVARSLWEKGLLERNHGTRAPYWFVPAADHQQIAAERQIVLLQQAVNSTRSRIEALARYASQPEVVASAKADAIKRFCKIVIDELDQLDVV